jgi:DNA-binding NarL/FixJ family response regulator
MEFRIVLGGGRKILREGLALLLEKQDGFKLIAESEDVSSVAKLVKALPADAAVLIESSASPILVEQIAAILRANRELRVIVLALNPEVRWLRNVLDVGVAGCLSRDCSGEELVAALRAAHARQLYLSPALLHMVVSAHVKSDSRAFRSLAPREREILRRIAEGQITKRIAADLGIGAKTVETHRRRIMTKLKASSVADLTKHAIRQGLTSLEVNA